MYIGVSMVRNFSICLLAILYCIVIGYQHYRPVNLHSGFVSVVKAQDDREVKKEFELLSLEPAPHYRQTFSEKFHGWAVLGKITISDEKEQQRVLKLLNKAIGQARKSGKGMANCFEPRHGIHLIKNGQVVDYVICFSCWRVEQFIDNNSKDMIPINESPRLAFNELFIKSEVPLAKER
jgi:hypothetical protein